MINHDEFPEKAVLSPGEIAEFKKLLNSEYSRYVKVQVRPLKNKIIIDSRAGTRGFVLYFEEGYWALVYFAETELKVRTGQEGLSADDISLIGDSAGFISASKDEMDKPYSWEDCDVAKELRKAHGQPVTGLAYGARDFNFCFPAGRELDVFITNDGQVRVFWEQW